MAVEMVRAGADWLALREPADAVARSCELVDELATFLAQDELVVHDLGSGTGSMARWLAPRLRRPQRWVLHDRDGELLARVGPEHETRGDDVTRLGSGELADAGLITASALLDMMTGEELERFVDVCSAPGCPVLVTLSVVGRVELAPADPLDPVVMEAFNAHQRRVTAGGRLLGPDAGRVAVEAFGARGRGVVVRPSPWRLGPEQSALAAAWFTGWLGAALEQRPELRAPVADYARRRLTEVAGGSLSVTVDHEDLLVRPSGGLGDQLLQL
jgi:hypothetical protein